MIEDPLFCCGELKVYIQVWTVSLATLSLLLLSSVETSSTLLMFLLVEEVKVTQSVETAKTMRTAE